MTKMKLFATAKIGDLNLANRVFMAPLTRSRANNEDAAPTEVHADYYAQRASAGLIISEGTVVSPQGVGYLNVPGIYSDTQTQAWKKVTEAVHDQGGKIFVQLWHVGRISHLDFLHGSLPVAPSAINPRIVVHTPTGKKKSVTPHELTKEEIAGIVNDFKSAGENAMKAGFDGIEIHSSNGYLFHQFFNNASNTRNDDYGGTDKNKSRFLFEVIDAVKEVVPQNRIGLRLNPMLHNQTGIDVDEQTRATFEHIIKKLNKYDLAYLHLSRPWQQYEMPFFVKDVIGHYRKFYEGFLVANNSYTLDSAESELSEKRADAVAFGRPFISNPDLLKRFINGSPLAEPDPSTFYTSGTKGYTDYPTFND